MRQWASPTAGWYGVFLAALVLPGGLLILACVLYHWLARRAARRRKPPPAIAAGQPADSQPTEGMAHEDQNAHSPHPSTCAAA